MVSSGLWKLEGTGHEDSWQEEELIPVRQRNKKILKKKDLWNYRKTPGRIN